MENEKDFNMDIKQKHFEPQEYKWWEIFFNQHKFIRKLSGAFWVKLEEEGYDWIKMDKEFFYTMKFRPEINFQIEDYTKPMNKQPRKTGDGDGDGSGCG